MPIRMLQQQIRNYLGKAGEKTAQKDYELLPDNLVITGEKFAYGL